jgi:hypothetical protein
MNEPMHRFKYTKLTKEQIGQKLAVAAAGPKSASAFSDVLVGKSLKIMTPDNGPVFNYNFKSKSKLTLTEGQEGSPVEYGYGALTLKSLVLFCHMDPKTQRGFNVVVDLKTNLATVFEVWLSSGITDKTMGGKTVELDNREVQRQPYFGYVDTGQAAPKALHHITNRLEGKGLYWKQDTGVETLEFYPSIVSSSFVELTRHKDDLSYCSPSDYVLVNDNIYVYSRTECEFSGIFTMYLADLFTETQVGVRLGFNEKDELEYYMFRGTGKVTGQLASLEPFNDRGTKGMSGGAKSSPQASTKGQRMTYRPIRDFAYMTDDQVHQAAMRSTTAFSGGAMGAPQANQTGNNSPFTDMLVGKEFTLRYDNGGPVRHYKFAEMFKLKYREDNEEQWHEEPYRAYEGDEQLVWFAHILTNSKPRASVAVAVDLLSGLTTCIHSHMGTKYFGNETTYRALFGVAEGKEFEAPVYMRHEHTDELVGHAFSWSYSDQMTSMHLYSSPHAMSWTIFTDNQTMGAHWGSPCIFVKLREGVYLFCQNEEACNGAEMIELINTKASHDCGFNYSGGSRGVSLGVTGAIGRHIGQFDIKKYFGPRVHGKGA